jgi:CheY-like chemotaxis protein
MSSNSLASEAIIPNSSNLIEAHDPDVVVTDIRMPPTGTDEGIRAAAWLRENRPKWASSC